MSVDQIEDVEVLRTLVKMQQQESLRLKTQLADALAKLQGKDAAHAEQLALQLEKTERQYAAALKRLFGPKSERSDKAGSSQKDRAPQTGHGPKEQPRLPLEEVVHRLSPEHAVCDLCSRGLEPWEGQFEESLEVDFVEPKVLFKKHLRQKYRCTCGGCIKTAPGPKKLFPKARYSVAFSVNIVLQKYCYHMPLERQTRELRRRGLDVTSATLWDYLFAVYTLLEPLEARLAEYVLSHAVIGADETTWRLLKSDKKGKSKTWWVWVRRCPTAVHYTLDESRSAEVAKRLLGAYVGIVVCDGYAAYTSLAAANPALVLANCWCHARRDLLPFEDDPRAKRALRVIQRMYRLEARVRGKPPDEIVAWRRRKTKPLLDAFFRWIDGLAIPPSGELRDAFMYIQRRKASLMLFIDDARLSPDNNETERVLRGVVVGRKNHYGSRSVLGTKVAALLYSLLDSAQLAGINPHEYLRAAVDAALDGVHIPLPHELVA